ncbi:MAG: hypothetical protein A2Y38_17410 [Spirochaetes bacterium GWB1_59_5]|nr:MAG: hypothetical protein A2Y38_17410 [Spirochaetes bacterium GWB1_59_5]
MKQAFYFGWTAPHTGHFLRATDGRSTLYPQAFGLPWSIGMLDGGLLKKSGEPERVTGRVRSMPTKAPYSDAPVWWAFYWWDRSGDSRPASNSGFYVVGFSFEEQLAALSFAYAEWPDVVLRQKHTLVLM